MYQIYAWNDRYRTPMHDEDGNILISEDTGQPRMHTVREGWDWFYKLHDLIDELNDGYKSIQVGMYSNKVDMEDQKRFILEHDVGLAAYAGIIMVFYLIFFLGGFSPIHCRMLVTIAGLICIYLSVFAGSLFS